MKKFLALLCAWIIRLSGYSLRITTEDQAGVLYKPNHTPFIFAFWHNRTALMPAFWARFSGERSLAMFISRSRDGQFITDVASHFGVKAVRGSSSKFGSSAALAAVHAARDPMTDIAITPDGPRGPRYQIHPGLIRIAQMTQRPIVAVTYKLAWKYQLNSWDRFQIPFPFSACCLKISEPISVPENATDLELDEVRKRVSEALGGD
jgi:lysophospholipid acyltransferase (LPLAT)-like uncharacterized protein